MYEQPLYVNILIFHAGMMLLTASFLVICGFVMQQFQNEIHRLFTAYNSIFTRRHRRHPVVREIFNSTLEEATKSVKLMLNLTSIIAFCGFFFCSFGNLAIKIFLSADDEELNTTTTVLPLPMAIEFLFAPLLSTSTRTVAARQRAYIINLLHQFWSIGTVGMLGWCMLSLIFVKMTYTIYLLRALIKIVEARTFEAMTFAFWTATVTDLLVDIKW